VGQHLVVARFFHVQNFSFKREDCLKAAVAALFGGAACGFSFHEKKFAAVGIALAAIGEFAGKASAIERAFAAGQVSGFARGFSSSRGVDRFVDDLFGYGRVLLEERSQLFVDHSLHDAGYIGI